jgi:uncharacterized membrane protein
MLTPTPAGATWPARLAYCAAAIFTLASAGTNLNYGISRGADAPSSAVWGAVSVAVSIVFALSWPALIKAVERRRWALVPMSAAALVLTGAYSVTAALGSASGGRANASATEQLITEQRTRAQTSYAAARAELTTLKPSRSVVELESLLAASSARLRGDCAVANITGVLVCPRNAALMTELGRARRRAELERKMDTAQAELERIAAPKQANSDAAALAGYLWAFGLTVQIDAVNRLLVLLAVLVVECGGGLALAVGMSLSGAERTQGAQETQRVTQGTVGIPSGVPSPEQLPQPQLFPTVPQRFAETVEVALVRVLREHGGKIVAGQRAIGRTLGVSATHVNRVLAKLSQVGIISLDATRRGSVVRLIVAGAT